MSLQTLCDDVLEECRGNPLLFTQKVIGLNQDEDKIHHKQIELVGLTKRRNVIHTGHRFGKTIGIAIKHLYYLVYKIGVPLDENWYSAQYRTLNVSFEYNMARKVYDIISKFFMRTSPFLKEGGPIISKVSDQHRRIEFAFGQVFSYSSLEEHGKHVEGDDYRYMSIDEAGQEKELGSTWDNTLKWRLIGASGFADFIGTPKPWSDPFFENLSLQAISDESIGHMEGSTYDNPYLPEKDLRDIEKDCEENSEQVQSYLYGKFVPLSGRLVSQTQVMNAIDKSLPAGPTDAKKLMFTTLPYKKDHIYVSFWDLAMESDWTVGITLDVTEIPYVLVNMVRVNRTNISSWSTVWGLMGAEARRYNLSAVYYDASGPHGSIIQESIEDSGLKKARPIQITAQAKRKHPSRIGKPELVNHIEMAFSYKQPLYDEEGNLLAGDPNNWGRVRIPHIKQLVSEVALYVRDDKKLQTDCVMALAGALFKARSVTKGYRCQERADNKMFRRRDIGMINPSRRVSA